MATAPQKQDFVSQAANAAADLLALRELLDEFNTNWLGSPSYSTEITQADLDAVESFGGLTTQELADGMYALEQVRGSINIGFVALLVMKNLR